MAKNRKQLTSVLIIGVLLVLLLAGVVCYRVMSKPKVLPNKTMDTVIEDNHPRPVVPDSSGGKVAEVSDDALGLLPELDEMDSIKGIHPGEIVARGRTEATIRKLQAESLLDSLSNLDHVDDYYYPGYHSQMFRALPFDEVQSILSNRRFIKILAELEQLGASEQHNLLEATLDKYIAQYRDLLSAFEIQNQEAGHALSPPDYYRISDGPGLPRTLDGTRKAIQSTLLAASLVGDVSLIPKIRELSTHPITGFEFNEEKYVKGLANHLRASPVFSEGILAQTAYQMGQRASNEGLSGFGIDKASFASIPTGTEIQTLVLPHYESRMIAYDLLHITAGYQLDLSHGFSKIDFMTTEDAGTIKSVIDHFLAR